MTIGRNAVLVHFRSRWIVPIGERSVSWIFPRSVRCKPYILPRLPRPKPPESPEKQNLRVKANFLRDQGLSYPEIAYKPGILLGAA